MEVSISPRVIAHRKFLASLNDKLDQPFIVPLETTYLNAVGPGGAAGVPAQSQYQVESGYEFFAFIVSGFMETIPSAMPANWVEDSDVNLPDRVTVQVQSNIGNRTLFSVPITLSQVIPKYKRGGTPWRLQTPWRVPSSAIITATWATLAGIAAPGWTVQHRFGIHLIGELIDQATLLKYGKIASRDA